MWSILMPQLLFFGTLEEFENGLKICVAATNLVHIQSYINISALVSLCNLLVARGSLDILDIKILTLTTTNDPVNY